MSGSSQVERGMIDTGVTNCYPHSMDVSSEITRITRFAVVGAGAFASYITVMTIAMDRFGADQVAGVFSGFIAGTFVSYFGNTLFSFGVRPTASNSVKFWIVTLVGLGLNLLLAFVCQHLGVPPLATALSIFIIVPVLNYLGHRFWTYAGAIPTVEEQP